MKAMKAVFVCVYMCVCQNFLCCTGAVSELRRGAGLFLPG